jgi:hypothetical protein
VASIQPEQPKRLEPVRADVQILARLEEALPQKNALLV